MLDPADPRDPRRERALADERAFQPSMTDQFGAFGGFNRRLLFAFALFPGREMPA